MLWQLHEEEAQEKATEEATQGEVAEEDVTNEDAIEKLTFCGHLDTSM